MLQVQQWNTVLEKRALNSERSTSMTRQRVFKFKYRVLDARGRVTAASIIIPRLWTLSLYTIRVSRPDENFRSENLEEFKDAWILCQIKRDFVISIFE